MNKYHRETPISNIGMVVSSQNELGFKTWVIGVAELDGWELDTQTREQADSAHRDLCRMARQSMLAAIPA